MPITIKECDDGIGLIIEGRGTVTDQEFIDSLWKYLTKDKEKFKTFKYVLIDQFALTTLDISDATIDHISGLLADVSSINPDSILAMVAYVSYGANIDLVGRACNLKPDPKQWHGSRKRFMINLELMIYLSTEDQMKVLSVPRPPGQRVTHTDIFN